MLLGLVLLSTLAAAPPLPGEGLVEPVAKGSTIRYVDLLRLVCPDLQVKDDDAASATATNAIGIRDVGTSERPPSVEDDLVIESVRTLAQLEQGSQVLVTFVMDQIRNLALFDLKGAPRLVDVVAVPGFPDDAGDYGSSLQLNPATDAYVFEAFHHNSSQGYASYTILFLHGNRIEKVAGIASLSCQTSGDVQSFEETVVLATSPDPGREFRSVVIKATLKHLADDPAEEHRPLRRAHSRIYTAIYRWDAAAGKFMTASHELQALDAFNRRNY